MTFAAGRGAGARAYRFAMLCGLATAGCSSGAPYAESSRATATVRGRVTSHEQPVTSGKVVFDPANVNRPNETAHTAEIGKDGTYTVTTLIGTNRVTVAIPGRPTKAAAPYVQQICEVASGSNTFDIAIP